MTCNSAPRHLVKTTARFSPVCGHGARFLLPLVLLATACAPRQLATVEDATPPKVRIVRPADGSRIDTATPEIDIGYGDEGSGISVVSFRATINGRDYSAEFDHDSRGALGSISSARALPLGENRLVVEMADRAGNRVQTEATFINAGGGWLGAELAPGAEPHRSVELILDASGSMREELGIGSRMDVAKGAVRALVRALPEGIPLGLRVFRDCTDIEALVDVTPVDREGYVSHLDAIAPAGGTPIVSSLLESFDALRDASGERIAVLVTDGGESCGGSLVEAGNRAADAGVRVVVIGFDIADAGLTRDLRELAESTGGAFFDARDPAQLGEALERGVLRIGYRVLDARGQTIAHGDVGGDRLELPLGSYSVRIDGTPPLLVEKVAITALGNTVIALSPTEEPGEAQGMKAVVQVDTGGDTSP